MTAGELNIFAILAALNIDAVLVFLVLVNLLWWFAPNISGRIDKLTGHDTPVTRWLTFPVLVKAFQEPDIDWTVHKQIHQSIARRKLSEKANR
jgi:hypothetical protein